VLAYDAKACIGDKMGDNPENCSCAETILTPTKQSNQWQVFCAELSHAETAMKVWPNALKRRAKVSAELFSETKAWAAWESSDFGFIFSLTDSARSAGDLYLKPYKRFKGRTSFVIGRGKQPSHITPEKDKRIFKLVFAPHDEANKLLHVKSGKYLACDRKGNLRLKKQREKGDVWEINRQNGPDTLSL